MVAGDDRRIITQPTRTLDWDAPQPGETDAVVDPLAGRSLPDRYQIKQVLARGGMGLVLEVHDRTLDRAVALKLLAPERLGDKDSRARFLREARAAGTLHHPGIVTVHDIDPEAGFIVMELIDGGSLADRLKDRAPLPPAEVRRIGLALLEALGAAHAAGIVHRDVKPANILFTGQDEVKLADFGVASFGDSELTSTGVRVGTPAYMAPEQLRGRLSDCRCDVYALGATLFEAATGKRMHGEDDAVDDPAAAVVASCGDADLAAAIARAVQERPQDRFATADEFALALGGAPGSRRRRGGGRAGVGGRRLAAVAVVGVAAAAGLALWRPWAGAPDGAPPAPAEAEAVINDQPVTVTVGLLPFTDRTGDPRLDFAASGLPHLLGDVLRRVEGLAVIGYYRIRERMPDDQAPVSDWARAAGGLGATMVVRGEIDDRGDGVLMTVIVERVDGAVLARIERQVASERLHQQLRVLAGDVASVLRGERVAITLGGAHGFEAERALQLGIDALERHDFDTAEARLAEAVRLEPDLAEAHYRIALVTWWRGRPVDVISAAIDRALAGPVDEAQRGFLAGLRLTLSTRRTDAIDHFGRLHERYPDNRDITYGLFEALFHGGRPGEAAAVYRRLVEISPRFRLGVMHVFDYHAARGDLPGLSWALGLLDPAVDLGHPVWVARTQVAAGDRAGAIAYMRSVHSLKPGSQELMLMNEELIGAHAVLGDLAAAQAVVDRLTSSANEFPRARLALAVAAGDRRAVARWRPVLARAAEVERGLTRLELRLELGLLALAEGDPGRLGADLAAIESAAAGGQEHDLRADAGRALLAGALGDRPRIAELAASPYPEVAAIAEAFAHEWAGHPAQAARAWRQAAGHTAEARFMPAYGWNQARMLRAAGDREGVIAACKPVMEPPRFTWSWAGFVRPCRAWTAEARQP